MYKNYELVIGLEVHIELKTQTKIFCSCPTAFGAEPNTQCCPVCMGHPGTLPVLNKKVVEYAIKAGIATNCNIAAYSKQDRKNYFYPDLPKAYQISQYDLPLCQHGYIEIDTENGQKKIGITRIHIEEDAGKLIHDSSKGTLIDCNRCGVPLIEIVSEPDMRSGEEAVKYLQKLRAIILYTGISDCRMNEGSLRADVNLSVRKMGDTKLGTKVEMKNINSFQFVGKAIEYEYHRQVDLIEKGESIVQETRRFEQSDGKTYSMRKKEDANDYRYFPDPDLPPIITDTVFVDEMRKEIPELPSECRQRYIEKFGLTEYDAIKITDSKDIKDYFDLCLPYVKSPKLLANIIISEIFRLLTPDDMTVKVKPEYLSELVNITEAETINSSTAKKVLGDMWNTGKKASDIVREKDLAQINDEAALTDIAKGVLNDNAKTVSDYRAGKLSASKALMGIAMGRARGKANPLMLQRIIDNLLQSLSN